MCEIPKTQLFLVQCFGISRRGDKHLPYLTYRYLHMCFLTCFPTEAELGLFTRAGVWLLQKLCDAFQILHKDGGIYYSRRALRESPSAAWVLRVSQDKEEAGPAWCSTVLLRAHAAAGLQPPATLAHSQSDGAAA